MSYEVGVRQLLEYLSSDHPLYADALVYQQRLQENIAQARKYGDTETHRAERAQIVDRLNQLALETVGVSFNDLCQTQGRSLRYDLSLPQGRPRPQFVKVKGTAPVYQITATGTRCWIPDGPTFESLGSWDWVEILASFEELKRFPPERPIPSVIHGERPWLVRIHSEPETFLIDDEGNRHYVPDGATLDAIINDRGGVDQLVDWEELERFPRGDPFPSVMSETPSIPGLESPVNLAQAQRSGRVFISHSSKDRDFVIRLASDLEGAGHSVWYAEWEIKVGDSIVQKINQGLAESGYLLIVLSPNSATSRWVQQELNTALIKQLNHRDVTVLPVLWRDCRIPLLLQDIKYADFREDYSTGLQELLDVLEREPSVQRPDSPGRRRPRRSVRDILRDNIWQGIGAIVGILALLVTLWAVFWPHDKPIAETPTTQVTKQAMAVSNTPVSSVSPTLPAVPTPEPLGIQYLVFDPPPPSAAETVKVFACTTGYGGEGITLKVSVNTATDGSDRSEWQVLKELGVPCFNQIDVPTWDAREWKAGTYLVKVEAKGPDDLGWEHAAVLTATYSLLERATSAPASIPTPDCRDVEVAFLELDLATGLGQERYLDASNTITLTHDEIETLATLSGRAELTGTNVADCTCYWEGRTPLAEPWQPITAPVGKCRFSMDLPTPVGTIHLKLTLGGQPPPRLFTIRIQQ